MSAVLPKQLLTNAVTLYRKKEKQATCSVKFIQAIGKIDCLDMPTNIETAAEQTVRVRREYSQQGAVLVDRSMYQVPPAGSPSALQGSVEDS